MKISTIWYRWLQVSVGVLMIFGISMVLTPGWILKFFSLMVYGSPGAMETGFSSGANDYIVLVHGVLGTVMFGWGLTMFLVLHGPFRRGEKEGWNMLALPLAAWFIPDTAFSLYTGFWQNAVLNTAFATLFAIPLIATRS
ncbi:MAG: hypothetical protein PVG91_10355, partial [Gammaproteobacteria bacterium]